MRKITSLFLFVLTLLLPFSAFAILSMELTQGVAGAIPIAIVPFAVKGDTPSQDVSGIVNQDLQNSGRFKVYGQNALNQFPSAEALQVAVGLGMLEGMSMTWEYLVEYVQELQAR